MSLLSLNNIKTNIGQYSILHNVSFEVKAGGVFVLLGRNGAGKTTTLRSIMGLWKTADGKISFLDQDITNMPTVDIAKLGIAYVPEDMEIFGGLSVEENLILATNKGKFDEEKIERIFQLFPALKTFWHKQAWALSGGQKQMLAIARAIVEPKKLILVDEPTKGLAPTIIDSMSTAFTEISTSSTILLVEQNFQFASNIGCDVAVIDDGQIIYTGEMKNFKADQQLQKQMLSLAV